jgi:hypothetical protein
MTSEGEEAATFPIGKERATMTVSQILAHAGLLLALSVTTLYSQLQALGISRFGSFNWSSVVEALEIGAFGRLIDVLNGAALSPWQYRIFAPYTTDQLASVLNAIGTTYPLIDSLILVRLFQNLLLFHLAWLLYKELGLAARLRWMGLIMVAWGVGNASYDSNISMDTYYDVIFYLGATLLALRKHYAWLIPLSALAMANRETSAFIPLLIPIMGIGFNWADRRFTKPRYLAITALACIAALSTYIGIRYSFGSREAIAPYDISPGLPLLLENLGSRQTWLQMMLVLGPIPLFAVAWYKDLPNVLQRMMLCIVPLWMLVHGFLGVMAEARLFLVPQILIFIPAVLVALPGSFSAVSNQRDRTAKP